ncbi:Shwachman-Bodian-diamond syndrome protein, partial [Alternaria alternata]|jgi:ribosome maturation protein SDO1|uniref:Ribosome maturation protein SDO1 n=3 Tax=Alternaria sect. Alternaria TaxID=2499237 RepID=A0A4Q4M694_9PLEO
MPVGINQPSNQIKLTNVSLVRMKKGKKRFEIACYKNKVLEWRNKIEKDLSNVLQIENVFLNVSKGQVAPKADLEKAFPKKSLEDIITDILDHGELQVGEKERNAELERTKNEVIDIVAGKLVDPKTKRVYTTGMIEKALDQLSSAAATQQGDKSENKEDGEDKGKAKELPKWSGIVTNKSAKSQALFAMKALIAHQPIPVARMQMKLRVTCPTSVLKQAIKTAPKAQAGTEEKGTTGTVKDAILGFMENIESQETIGAEWEAVGLVEPGAFKGLNELIEGQTKGRGNVEVLEMAVGADD